MRKSIISTLSIFLMGLMTATPLFSVENCTMPCCEQIELSCCEKDKPMDCPMEMSNCEMSTFVPLMVAPLHEIDGNTDIDVSTMVQTHSFFENAPAQFINQNEHFQNHHPPNFHLPLLI
ncbi:MAG: hypothetical protein QF835_03935 [Candidatus Marinimicrobia bacterium]|nr:hypothetical protein [Candidatus Neomarinimicrobiota bacterium]MDP6614152.1 hypothetical protein [Candidatus Neomarinimicrobiota bacterium]